MEERRNNITENVPPLPELEVACPGPAITRNAQHLATPVRTQTSSALEPEQPCKFLEPVKVSQLV